MTPSGAARDWELVGAGEMEPIGVALAVKAETFRAWYSRIIRVSFLAYSTFRKCSPDFGEV